MKPGLTTMITHLYGLKMGQRIFGLAIDERQDLIQLIVTRLAGKPIAKKGRELAELESWTAAIVASHKDGRRPMHGVFTNTGEHVIYSPEGERVA